MHHPPHPDPLVVNVYLSATDVIKVPAKTVLLGVRSWEGQEGLRDIYERSGNQLEYTNQVTTLIACAIQYMVSEVNLIKE
jgi:hypothetical protein